MQPAKPNTHSINQSAESYNSLSADLLPKSDQFTIKKGLLGSIAESSSTRGELSTGAISKHSASDAVNRQKYTRLNRAADLLPNERIAVCQRAIAPFESAVNLNHNPETSRTSFGNLQCCESLSCPFCASWRAEQMRQEISLALALATEKGYYPVLLTLTLSHTKHDDIADTRKALVDARKALFSGRWYDDLIAEYGIVGRMRNVESPYGANGWHVHEHHIILMESELAGKWLVEFQGELKTRWLKMLEKQGKTASWANGLDIRSADHEIADYITKFGHEPQSKTWGADSELAMSSIKRADRGSLSPFQLLDAANGHREALDALAAIEGIQDTETLKNRAGGLFRAYFQAFKNQSRMYWTPGLKNLLGLTDERLAEFIESNQETGETQTIIQIPRQEWKRVYGAFNNTPDLRPELLALARAGDSRTLITYLAQYGIFAHTPNTHNHPFLPEIIDTELF